ncbi:hypothetical protein MMC19_003806 [Ptychographa xylographoides]|nr:hypothetical protein [Ptychographa xylographoides]
MVSAEERIIAHMNADHTDSLTRFLAHYAQAYDAHSVLLKEITLSSMTIAYANGSEESFVLRSKKTIPIDPPLNDWKEVRERMVSMDEECKTALERGGRSEIVIANYTLPSGIVQIAQSAFAPSIMLAFAVRSGLLPGSWLRAQLLRINISPSVIDRAYTLVPYAFWIIIAVHAIEVVWFARAKLWKYNVKYGSNLWRIWMLSDFIEGYSALTRFNRLVLDEELRMEKERRSH